MSSITILVCVVFGGICAAIGIFLADWMDRR